MARYRGAMKGLLLPVSLTRKIIRVMSNQFCGIKSIILIPETGDKVTLEVRYNAKQGCDEIFLETSNYRTGEKSTLFNAKLISANRIAKPGSKE